MIKVEEYPPLYFLDDSQFPDPYEDFIADGLVGVSLDLSADKLLSGYSKGFFPWYQDMDGFFHWFMPEQRMILRCENVKRTKNLRKKLRSQNWEFKINSNFPEVIKNCAEIKRPKHMGEGTWINKDFITFYKELYNLGFVLSIESYFKGELVGGLYGVIIGKYFSGESMFAKKSDASKLALIFLCDLFLDNGVEWIDCQTGSEHLQRMGAEVIPKKEFLEMLSKIETKKEKNDD